MNDNSFNLGPDPENTGAAPAGEELSADVWGAPATAPSAESTEANPLAVSEGQKSTAEPTFSEEEIRAAFDFGDTSEEDDTVSPNYTPMMPDFTTDTAATGFEMTADETATMAEISPDAQRAISDLINSNIPAEATPAFEFTAPTVQPGVPVPPPVAPQTQNAPTDTKYYSSAPAPTGNEGSDDEKGKKIAFGVIIACLVIALAIMVKGIFFPSDTKVEPTTTGSFGDSAVTDTTASMVPQVTVGSTQNSGIINIDSVNSVWVADKVRPSIVGVMTYVDGQLAGEGSGVLWGVDPSGTYTYVVTCAHVIDEAGATFSILLLDGRRFEAEMVATDVRTDIGVIRVKTTGLPIAELGDSSALKIGEPIYAIGNPGGSEYFGSITDGIVSAIDRSISATYTMTCIQHNAAINPGNSGGALVNTAGQIVGINSSKIASTDFEGMGFAVPMSIVKPVVDALIQYKYVPNRPKLGIEYATVSDYQLYSMVVSIKGLPQGSLVIAGISEDSTLANTQAQVGDLIIGVNGKDMDDSSVLLDLIDTGAVGDTLTLTLCRIEKRTYKTTTFDVTITLVEDRGSATVEEETTTEPTTQGGYSYGGSGSFEDFFNDYFGY